MVSEKWLQQKSNLGILHLHISTIKVYLESFSFFFNQDQYWFVYILGDEQKRKEIFENKKQQLTVYEITVQDVVFGHDHQ